MQKKKEHYQVLLIEDNPGDIRLTLEAFNEIAPSTTVNTVQDGVEALEYLRKIGGHQHAVTPDVILLDLNLPKRDGRELLKIIKSDIILRFIPVIVLTTSAAEQDILNAYELHANCFISKPLDVDTFFKLIQRVKDFWLDTVKLPSHV